MITVERGRLSTVPDTLRQWPALLSSPFQPPEADTHVATQGGHPVAWLASHDETIGVIGAHRTATCLRHAAMVPGAPPTTVTDVLASALSDGPATLILAPAAAAAQPWGFVPFTNGCRLAFPPGRPRMSRADGLRPLGDDDEAALQALYERYCRRLTGPRPWDRNLWSDVFRQPDVAWFVHESQGVVTGAIGVAFSRQATPPTARALAVIDDDVDALTALMAYAGHVQDLGFDLRFDALPVDRPVLALGDVVSKQRASLDRAMAVRPGLPAAWWPALRVASDDGDLVLGITDPLGLWPPVVHLRWRDHEIVAWDTADAVPSVTMTLAGLAALVIGELNAEQLAYAGWLSGPRYCYDALDALGATLVLHRFSWEGV